METTARPSQFTGSNLDQRGHICAFFNSIEEQHRVLLPYIQDGFDQRGKGYHFVDPELREEHLRWLAEAGINTREVLSTGQLEVSPWQDGTLRGGRFDQDAWGRLLEHMLRSGLAAGYVQTRVLVHMEWALTGLPGIGDLIEFEARLNYVLPRDKDAVVCAYDLTKFGASVAMDALRTHPLVIIGGLLHENPFFVPPDQFLVELRERRSARKGASTAD
jgi:MEDS: MEthanogen/methylotroph, DcmR Sensory domain